MEKDKIKYQVPALEKGIDILEYLSMNPSGQTLLGIRHALDISQTTAYRMLNTLVSMGYLMFDEETKQYRLSLKLLSLGYKALNEHDLLNTVLPYLGSLRDKVKETACFGVMGDEKGVFIEQAQGIHTFRFVLSPGKPFDLHCSAPGKAIMAYLPEESKKHYLSCMTFTKYNSNTITNLEDYEKELSEVRMTGYALDNEEEMTGVICIGAPIFNYTGFPCGAIWISGPKDRLSKDKIKIFAEDIKNTTQVISEKLGYNDSKNVYI